MRLARTRNGSLVEPFFLPGRLSIIAGVNTGHDLAATAFVCTAGSHVRRTNSVGPLLEHMTPSVDEAHI
jgi:hypothetical protein